LKTIKISLFLSIAFLFSCAEDTQVNLISGQLFESCDNPLGPIEIALKANVGASFGDPLILGSGVSEGNGVFNFTYELEEDDKGTADIILITNSGFETLITGLEVNKDMNLTLYRNNTSKTLIELAGSMTFELDDTLFYGLSQTGEEKFVVQPSNGIVDSLLFAKPNTVDNQLSTIIYYGVNRTDFNLSKEALTIKDSVFQNISITFEGCNPSRTAMLLIN